MLPIFKHNPDHRARIIDRLERLSLNAANTGQRDACARVMKRCEDFVRDLQTQTLTKAASADDFENRKHPLARLYFIIVKAQASGPLTMAKSGLTSGRMDKETGTPLMTFEKLKEVRSMNDLHLIWNDFQKAVYVVGRNGGRPANQQGSPLHQPPSQWWHSKAPPVLEEPRRLYPAISWETVI